MSKINSLFAIGIAVIALAVIPLTAAAGGPPPSTHGKGSAGGVFRTSPHGKR